MNFIKKNSTTLIGLTAGLIALLCAVFLPAAAAQEVISSFADSWHYVTIIGLAFNCVDVFVFRRPMNGPNEGQLFTKAATHVYGGMSIFALVSVVLLIVGIVLLVVFLFTKKKPLNLIGSICLVLSGIFIFFILELGTDIDRRVFINSGHIIDVNMPFKDHYRTLKLDIGTLFYALATIFGGAIGILDFFKKPNDATLPPKQVCAPVKFIKTNLSAIILIIVGLIAFISTIVFPGITYSGHNHTNLWGLIFGNASFSIGSYITGGTSIFGLISFIVLCVGIGFAVTSIFKKNKNLEFIGAICITVAGFLMLFVMEVGTDILTETYSDGSSVGGGSFLSFYLYYQYYIGAIVYVFVAILGGAMGIANKFKKLY